MSIVQHRELQSVLRRRFELSENDSVLECVMKILDDKELHYPAAEATEFLFGCEIENIPVDHSDVEFYKLFSWLWEGNNNELIKLIAANHSWGSSPMMFKYEVLMYVYPGEFMSITRAAKNEVSKFIDSAVTVGGE